MLLSAIQWKDIPRPSGPASASNSGTTHCEEREMKVTFAGSGDAFGTEGRFNTCFHVASAEGNFLIDCGASSLIALKRLSIDPNAVGTIFISHLHGDHFGGLPFFLLDAQFYSRRTSKLTLVGSKALQERVTAAMEVFFPGSSATPRRFETEFKEIEPDTTHDINGVRVTAGLVQHACGAPPFALRLECEGKVLAYTGDTEWTESLIATCRHADLLIAEALTFERKIRFHLDYASLAANLPRIGAKRVVLTHMGPDFFTHAMSVQHERASDGLVISV